GDSAGQPTEDREAAVVPERPWRFFGGRDRDTYHRGRAGRDGDGRGVRPGTGRERAVTQRPATPHQSGGRADRDGDPHGHRLAAGALAGRVFRLLGPAGWQRTSHDALIPPE